MPVSASKLNTGVNDISPIIIVRFKEPVVIAEPIGWPRNPFGLSPFRQIFMPFVQEVTLVVNQLPQLVRHPDGASSRGYLDFGDGVDFDARNIESMTVIP